VRKKLKCACGKDADYYEYYQRIMCFDCAEEFFCDVIKRRLDRLEIFDPVGTTDLYKYQQWYLFDRHRSNINHLYLESI